MVGSPSSEWLLQAITFPVFPLLPFLHGERIAQAFFFVFVCFMLDFSASLKHLMKVPFEYFYLQCDFLTVK